MKKNNNLFTLIVSMVVISLVAVFAKTHVYYLYKFGSDFSVSKYIIMLETGINFDEVSQTFSHGVFESAFIPSFVNVPSNPLENVEDFEYETNSTFSIMNRTSKIIDKSAIIDNPYDLKIEVNSDEPQVLIFHTHGTESYQKGEFDDYEESGDARTLHTDYNMSVIAKTLTNSLNSAGVNTLYADDIHDYPSYVESYSNSYKTVSEYLENYPSIKLVIDVHRDAVVSANGEHKKETVTINGEESARVMVVIGSDGGGLEHDYFMTNLNVGANIHNTIDSKYDGLMRDLYFTNSRYNQQLSKGQILVEVGYSGNTLEEAKNGIKYFADGLLDYIIKE